MQEVACENNAITSFVAQAVSCKWMIAKSEWPEHDLSSESSGYLTYITSRNNCTLAALAQEVL